MLGAALGIYSHVALDGVLFEERRDMSVRMLLAVLFSNSLTSLTLYFQLWPHEEAGDAISSGQLKFHATLWLLLVAATALLPAKRMEVKQA